MYFYILLSAFYRLSCGALILAINWLMVTNNQSFSYLAMLVTLTFLPAVLVPFFYKNKKLANGVQLTSYALMACFVLTLCLFFSHAQLIILILNTLLWFFFFIMESSWESWFVALSKSYSSEMIDKFSSLSMSVNQASLMLGPIIAAFIFKENPQKVLLISALIFLVIALMALFSSRKNTQDEEENSQEHNTDEKIKLSGVEIVLILIWPTLAVFNFMLPVQISYHGGTMVEVGILDGAMGLGMIFSGLMLSKEKFKTIFISYRGNVFIILIGIFLWLFGEWFVLKILAVFLLGLCFNMNRIFIRSVLAKKYQSYTVGRLISKANSFSFFIIILTLFLFYDVVSVNWALPFIFTALISLLVSV